jgi:hypothetical protein
MSEADVEQALLALRAVISTRLARMRSLAATRDEDGTAARESGDAHDPEALASHPKPLIRAKYIFGRILVALHLKR